jgi:hypothetical protein
VKAFLFPVLAGAALLLAGCGRKAASPGGAEAAHFHQNVPPHGGTPVALGDDYCLEIVRDAENGTLSAYVLDDEMEEFIRLPAPSLPLLVRVAGEDRPLVLSAVATSCTGETVGDTALFQARADWLKTTAAFGGTVQSITVRGTTFTGVRFSFPGPADKG